MPTHPAIYQEDNNLEYFKYSYNKKINIGGKYYIIKNANYDLFDDVISIVITPEIRFSYDIFVPNYDEYIIKQLEMIGYVKSEVCGVGPNLITNAHLGLYYFTNCDYSNGGMGYVCKTKEHAISIAAIRDDTDKYQWFEFPYNEIDFCENDKAKNLLPQYVELLSKELSITGEIAKNTGVTLESIYIGGGTPTTLSAEQLEIIINAIRNSFDLNLCREFTVEAGRPDTITEDKLLVLKNSPVDRISINPQTFNNSVLEAVGRRHTAEDTVRIFELARKIGFDNINMDLIAGLPTDSVEDFKHSLDTAMELDPENITVHTLAVKRASGIGQNSPKIAVQNATIASEMLSYTYNRLYEKYHPYYMYRQSKSAGSLENVGWAKDNTECIYNIFMMEECHTILSCGGGAVTKLKAPKGNEIERVLNFKYPFEYIAGFDELMERKKRITEFYNTYK